MIAHRIDLLTLHEMVIASAVPNPMPAVAAVAIVCHGGTIHPGPGRCGILGTRRFHLSSGDLRSASLRANGKRLGHPQRGDCGSCRIRGVRYITLILASALVAATPVHRPLSLRRGLAPSPSTPAQHRHHLRRRPGVRRPGRVRASAHQDAAPRHARVRGPEADVVLRVRASLLGIAVQPAHRALRDQSRHQRRAHARKQERARSRRNHHRRHPEVGRLPDGHGRQVASGQSSRVLPDGARVRLLLRTALQQRHGPALGADGRAAAPLPRHAGASRARSTTRR